MFDAEKYIEAFQRVERGAPRLRELKKAIEAADEAKSNEWSFRFRNSYLNESTFESDDVDAMVIFPEMVALYDKDEELQADDDNFHMLMWSFKLMIENAVCFHHIPLEQVEQFFSEFKQRLEKAGRSLRTYYYLREVVSERTGNLLPDAEYGKYRDLPADDLKDCTACETSHDVRMALIHDKADEARKIGEPIFSGEIHCSEVPETTYAAWIEYDIRHGDYRDARKLAKRLTPMIRHRMDMLRESGVLLHLYSVIDRQIGVTVFRHELRNFLNCRNHWMRLQFAMGAYKLFSSFQTDAFFLILPPEFALTREDHHYLTSEFRDFFYNEAKTLAEKFDARNGNHMLMEELERKDPPFDEEAVDLIYGDAEQVPSAIGAVCTTLPEELTIDSVRNQLDQDGRFQVVLARVEEENGVLAFQIAEGDGSANIHQVLLVCQPTPPLSDFRPASPVGDNVADDVTNSEGMVLCIMPFEDLQADLALHFQLKLLNLLFPDAVAYLDLSRQKLLPSGWVAMEAHSDVPPLVNYLYNLQLRGTEENDHLWITTTGLRCLGLRDIEIWDATKENFPRFCDMLCFATERILLREEMSNAREPFSLVYRDDGSEVLCTWVPASEAVQDYPEGDAAGYVTRSEMIGDEAQVYDLNAVLYLHDGEAADGSQKRKRLGTITEADFEHFNYGLYIITSRKIAAMAQERYGIFAMMAEKYKETSYACVRMENEDRDEIWMQVTKAEENQLTGKLAEDCPAGKAGETFTVSPARLTDFSVRVNENLIIHPNTAYIALEID